MPDAIRIESLVLALPGIEPERARGLSAQIARAVAERLDGHPIDARLESVRLSIDPLAYSSDDGLVRSVTRAIVAALAARGALASEEATRG